MTNKTPHDMCNLDRARKAGYEPPRPAVEYFFFEVGEQRVAQVWFDTVHMAWRAEPLTFRFGAMMQRASYGYTPDDALFELERFAAFHAEPKVVEFGDIPQSLIDAMFASHKRLADNIHRFGMGLNGRIGAVPRNRRIDPEAKPVELSAYAKVQRTPNGYYLASHQVGNRIYHGVGSYPDIAIASLEDSIRAHHFPEEGEAAPQNYTIMLPDGGVVPASWASALGVKDPNLHTMRDNTKPPRVPSPQELAEATRRNPPPNMH